MKIIDAKRIWLPENVVVITMPGSEFLKAYDTDKLIGHRYEGCIYVISEDGVVFILEEGA